MESRPVTLSDNTIAELIALEDQFFHFFKTNAKDLKGLVDMSESAVHKEFTHWLNCAPAFIGTFHLHGSSVLRSLIATVLNTMQEHDAAEKVMNFTRKENDDHQ